MSNANNNKDNVENTKAESENLSATMPQVSFSTFILSLYSSALVQLGEVPDPDSGSVVKDIEMARHTIDILALLHEKTLNNLDAEELRLIDGLLYELRMKFVVKNKA